MRLRIELALHDLNDLILVKFQQPEILVVMIQNLLRLINQNMSRMG
jgi:hypothetical protein